MGRNAYIKINEHKPITKNSPILLILSFEIKDIYNIAEARISDRATQIDSKKLSWKRYS